MKKAISSSLVVTSLVSIGNVCSAEGNNDKETTQKVSSTTTSKSTSEEHGFFYKATSFCLTCAVVFIVSFKLGYKYTGTINEWG